MAISFAAIASKKKTDILPKKKEYIPNSKPMEYNLYLDNYLDYGENILSRKQFQIIIKLEFPKFAKLKEVIIKCPITQNKIRSNYALFPIKVFIQNPNIFTFEQHHHLIFQESIAFKINNFTQPNGMESYNCHHLLENVWIVPKFITSEFGATMNQRYLISKLMNKLPIKGCSKPIDFWTMSYILPFLGCKKKYVDQITCVSDFQPKINEKTEYSTIYGIPFNDVISNDILYTETPIGFTLEGLLLLVELEYMDIAVLYENQLVVLSNDCWYWKLPNGKSTKLHNLYFSLKEMKRRRELYLRLIQIECEKIRKC
jgi:hypothetical protein